MTTQEFPRDFPKLETKRLVLRKLEESDAPALFENYSDEDIAKNFMDKPLGDIKQASQFIEAFNAEFSEGKAITWAITIKRNHQMIGTCSYMIETSTSAEIGYDLAKTHWGKGIMTEALKAMIGYGFDELGFENIKADTLSNNTRSINLLKRLEFKLDDVRENSHYFIMHKKEYESPK